MFDKSKKLKEDGVASSAVNTTSPAVAGTASDVTWVNKKKKLREIIRRVPNGTD